MAKKEIDKVNKKVEALSLSELLSYREASSMLFDYYDNMVKANVGDYININDEKNKKIIELTNKYLAIDNLLFKEIKDRVDDLIVE